MTKIHISCGQSWRDKSFDSFDQYGWSPTTVLACQNNVGGVLGALTNSAGIWIPGHLTNTAISYAGTDPITIGRCAALTEQMLSSSAELILEFCASYPASSWTSGKGGGLQPGGVSWTNMLKIIASLNSTPMDGPAFRSVGYTQGRSDIDTVAAKISDLTAMCADFDALALAGTDEHPLDFYFGIAAPKSSVATLEQSFWGVYEFCRTNANGRSWAVSPWYQWPFDADGIIHLAAYGTARLGEIEGYAKYVVDHETGSYRPLWRSLTAPIAVAGQTITIPFDRPSGAAFARSGLRWHVDPTDGLKVWPGHGWHVKRDGVELPAKASISGLNVLLAVTPPIAAGDVLDVSYAFHGPGAPSPGPASGVGGNLMMIGPPSPLFPGKTINAWAWPFAETVQA